MIKGPIKNVSGVNEPPDKHLELPAIALPITTRNRQKYYNCAAFASKWIARNRERRESTKIGSRIASVFVFVVLFVFALWSSAAAAPAMTIQPSHYARLGSLTAAEAVSLGDIALARVTLVPSRYASLGNLTAAEAAELGVLNIAPPAGS